MTSQKICKLAAVATKALDKSAAALVSVAALEQYNYVVEMVKEKTHIDINEFFTYIALLAVMCWVGHWLDEIFRFLCHTLPKFFKNLMCGKFSLCLLDCGSHESEHCEESEHSEETDY